MHHGFSYVCAGLLALFAAPLFAQEGELILPDLTTEPEEMTGNEFDTDELPGRVLFRFDTSIPNLGPGFFRLDTTGVDSGDGRETVVQRIDRSGADDATRDAGDFLFNPENNHMEADDWVNYNLREVLPGGEAGPILRMGQKQSVRITSTRTIDSVDSGPRILARGGNHGIGIGWTDIYSRNLDEQWVDVTGVARGEYWLEVVVDPGQHVLEADETNNSARIKVNLNSPAMPDFPPHRADWQGSGNIDLGELLRVIQLYNAGAYHCEANTDDGFAPGPGKEICKPHTSDYAPQNWSLNLSELLRVVQLFNFGAYFHCPGAGTEDGYCPGEPGK